MTTTRARATSRPMRSVDVGSRRITEMFLHSDPPTARELDEARAHIAGALRPFFDALRTRPRAMVSLAGAATSFSAIDLELAEYDSERVHLSCLTGPQLSDLIGMLASLPLERRRQVVGPASGSGGGHRGRRPGHRDGAGARGAGLHARERARHSRMGYFSTPIATCAKRARRPKGTGNSNGIRRRIRIGTGGGLKNRWALGPMWVRPPPPLPCVNRVTARTDAFALSTTQCDTTTRGNHPRATRGHGTERRPENRWQTTRQHACTRPS